MRNYISIIFLCLCSLLGHAHNITLKDSVTNAPIFSATVCDAEGNYVVISTCKKDVRTMSHIFAMSRRSLSVMTTPRLSCHPKAILYLTLWLRQK